MPALYGKQRAHREFASIVPFTGFNPKETETKEFHRCEICKSCHYCRRHDNSTLDVEKVNWRNDVACHYMYDTDIKRETRPTDTHCDYYIQREKKQ
jgi:hypothetical protein